MKKNVGNKITEPVEWCKRGGSREEVKKNVPGYNSFERLRQYKHRFGKQTLKYVKVFLVPNIDSLGSVGN